MAEVDSIVTKNLTGDDLAEIVALNPDKRYELLEGQLIEMAPTGFEHGRVENYVAYLLTDANLKENVGIVLTGEIGFYTRGDTSTVRAADVAFVLHKDIPADEKLSGYTNIVPVLAVEVVSPNDRSDKIETKTQEWLAFGVKVIWNVYPQTKQVHVFNPESSEAQILNEQDSITLDPHLPNFRVSVARFFDLRAE